MTSVFGTRGRDFGDEGRIRQFFDCQAEWAGMLDQGAVPPFDVFPFLRHVPDVLTPWRGWRRRAAALKSKQNGLYRDLFREARARVERQGKAGGSFVASLLRNNARDGYSEVELEYITGFLMEGGSDTTAGAFETFVLAMAAYQEVQRRAQAEVDSVFGEDGVRSGQAGADALPYLKACFLETLRWRPGFPLAIPHATTQDDIYQGYHIPANTTILMNIWAISHDPDEYEDPDSFRPERFLDGEFGTASGSREEPNETAEGGPGDQTDSQSQSQSQSQSRRPTYGFGAGRRVCAGQRMAENSMLMTMSKLLWYFDVVVPGGRAPDTGVRTAFKDAILTGPKPFDVGFDVRGERRRGVLVDEWAKADAWLRQFE
ncbi:O-methylsterigmatocystin oxidoreductase [Colletotrichum tanaceti]|nr:O-methylsterigmatocystin oxidoreductase [Colletotrichum tanaceti]